MGRVGAVKLIPFVAAVVVMSGFALVATFIQQTEARTTALRVAEISRHIEHNIIERVSADLLAIRRMAERWGRQGGTPEALWFADARAYVEDHEELRALQWAGPDYVLRWIEPLEGNEAVVGLNITFEETRAQIVRASQQSRIPQISPALNFVQGGVGFLSYAPIFIEDGDTERFDGFIVGVFSLDLLLQTVIPEEFVDDVGLRIMEASELLIASGDAEFDALTLHRDVALPGTEWTLDVAPTAQLIAEEQSPLARIVILLGMLVSSGLAIALRAIQRERERLKEASRAKSDFLANMSHEIRTPMNGILGMARVLANEDLDEHLRDRIETIRKSGDALMHLLDDILDLSKIEAGRLELENTTVYPRQLADRVASLFADTADEKGVGLEISVDDERPRVGDPFRIGQILQNLVSNALKFTTEGQVTVTIRAKDDSQLVLTVNDTGIGMSEDQLARIFEKFSQADSSTTRQFGGTGLGLSICLGLTQKMGGEIDVTSEENKGSSFKITLPLPVTEWANETPEQADQKAGTDTSDFEGDRPRLLIAEDNLTNQIVLKAYLDKLPLDIDLVDNGAKAVERYKEADFDLLVFDIQMPQMSGVEALQAIRKLDADADRLPTPAVALTANVMVEQVRSYEEAGFNAHLEKPINPGALNSTIRRLVAQSREDRARAARQGS